MNVPYVRIFVNTTSDWQLSISGDSCSIDIPFMLQVDRLGGFVSSRFHKRAFLSHDELARRQSF